MEQVRRPFAERARCCLRHSCRSRAPMSPRVATIPPRSQSPAARRSAATGHHRRRLPHRRLDRVQAFRHSFADRVRALDLGEPAPTDCASRASDTRASQPASTSRYAAAEARERLRDRIVRGSGQPGRIQNIGGVSDSITGVANLARSVTRLRNFNYMGRA
jgi:hypothetical protein